jgi:acyl carrier protein
LPIPWVFKFGVNEKMDEHTQTIIGWINENCFNNKPSMEVTAETSLLSTNILDSLDFLGLVEFLQQKYGVEIDEEDMSPDNFESPSSVANLVASLK